VNFGRHASISGIDFNGDKTECSVFTGWQLSVRQPRRCHGGLKRSHMCGGLGSVSCPLDARWRRLGACCFLNRKFGSIGEYLMSIWSSEETWDHLAAPLVRGRPSSLRISSSVERLIAKVFRSEDFSDAEINLGWHYISTWFNVSERFLYFVNLVSVRPNAKEFDFPRVIGGRIQRNTMEPPWLPVHMRLLTSDFWITT